MGCRKLQFNEGFRFVGNESDIQHSESQHRKDRPTGFSTYNANDQLTLESSTTKGDTIYSYDTNGSQIGKVNTTANESYLYTYNLQNRLETANIARMEGTSLVEITSSYLYNQSGIRVRSNSTQTVDGVATTKNRKYLLDAGMTGYQQVLEEIDATNNTLVKSYTIGDDVLNQRAVSSGQSAVSYLLYDGHGSTRLLTSASSAVSARYNYDAYGIILGGFPNVTTPNAHVTPESGVGGTDMLYSGEQFDPNLQMQYLRARYYDQNAGVFNRLDDYMGDNYDPQSLHKYAYAHCNPIMGIDPSGLLFSSTEILTVATEIVTIFTKYWTYLRVGFIVADILAITNIVMKGFLQGFDTITAGEWAEVALITATAFFGGKIGRALAKAMFKRLLFLPTYALKSYQDLKWFVRSKVILKVSDEVVDVVVDGKKVIENGYFTVKNGNAIIQLNGTGQTVKTLLHEYIHYMQWVYGRKRAVTWAKYYAKYQDEMEEVTKIIMTYLL